MTEQDTTIKDEQRKKIKRILAAIQRIQRTDRNAVENLERLADMAEKNPNKYFLALKFL